jgi:hypothetical protein
MNNIKTQKFFAFKKEQNQKIVYSCFYKSMMQMRLCGDYSETVVLIEVTQDENGNEGHAGFYLLTWEGDIASVRGSSAQHRSSLIS